MPWFNGGRRAAASPMPTSAHLPCTIELGATSDVRVGSIASISVTNTRRRARRPAQACAGGPHSEPPATLAMRRRRVWGAFRSIRARVRAQKLGSLQIAERVTPVCFGKKQALPTPAPVATASVPRRPNRGHPTGPAGQAEPASRRSPSARPRTHPRAYSSGGRRCASISGRMVSWSTRHGALDVRHKVARYLEADRRR